MHLLECLVGLAEGVPPDLGVLSILNVSQHSEVDLPEGAQLVEVGLILSGYGADPARVQGLVRLVILRRGLHAPSVAVDEVSVEPGIG